ncbi:UdgX family uracil-DNA binding protein [uncultured Tateyamaria sp.]|uniref:UdgX family uracil-DNA binding protein n=1 Tax=uncultured Tateyamaria sp. TaxID=455651 RepID=UPI00260C6190|nr:UdgX family uracil-DNA binding protein [uncultured Tateyamaria sp.]
MTQRIVLPRLGTGTAWRDSARVCLAMNLHPNDVRWSDTAEDSSLFDAAPDAPPAVHDQAKVPKAFVSLAQSVVWHTDADRFDRLYAALYRIRSTPTLIRDRADPAIAQLRKMEKAVHRCQHKMKAFVRFREIGDPTAPRRSFAAWFEPTHNTMEPTADFFAKRFADMDWRIVTPSVSAIFEGGKLCFALDLPRPDFPEDANEKLWTTYFCNIFNPARLKVNAMTSEMPKKYWKNLPEAASIPHLIAGAPARARAMADAAPTLPPVRTARVQRAAADFDTAWKGPGDALGAALSACTRCPLHATATQAVAGCGPDTARLMIVGEQPGDQEDLTGQPFSGPAGKVLDGAFAQAGVDREGVYLTNAVKHFKHIVRGKRRIHQSPDRTEIEHCRFWLDAEIRRIQPKIIVAMGATAAMALTGDRRDILKRRGHLETGLCGRPVMITVHPSHILRTPDKAKQNELREMLVGDLSGAHAISLTETAM